MRKLSFVKNALCFLLLLIITIVCFYILIDKSEINYNGECIEYIIRPGDTYWSVADKHHIKGDIRIYVRDIEKVNGIQPQNLQPGDVLIIPLQKE